MSYALAVDVGTSFTAAAVVRFHQGASGVPECLPLGSRGASVPSVLYYPAEGAVLVGEAAERRGLDSPERVVREFKRRIGDDVPFVLGTLLLRRLIRPRQLNRLHRTTPASPRRQRAQVPQLPRIPR